MSGGFTQNLTPTRLRLIWFVFILFYMFVCSLAGLYAVGLQDKAKTTIARARVKEIEKLIRENNAKKNKEEAKVQESLYIQNNGGINPGFKKMVSAVPTYKEAPKERAYEKQLAEYEAREAERERVRLEEARRQAEQEAKERAILEQERIESLRQERLEREQMQATQPAQVAGGISSSKTFTAPKTQKPQPKTQQKTQQKTVIGTLKTSKLGESSFQSY